MRKQTLDALKTDTPLQSAVDQLALIKAQIADLRTEEEALKKTLIDSGLSSIDGELHSATISECAGRETTDWKTVALKFSPSRQLLKAHTSQGDDYFQVRVFARKT